MISASFSLSLPRLGWKSTSMPRSLKICTAAGDKASEMRTLGLGIGGSFEETKRRPGRSATWREEPGPISRDGGYGSRVARRRAACPGRRLKNLRRLRERGLGFGERPVDPLRQSRDVPCFHRGAAPDAQARRRIAIMREIVAGAFLLHQGNELLGKVGLRIRAERRDRGIDHL